MNVRKEFHGLSNFEIKERIKNNNFQFAVFMQQIEHDFNFGTLVRNSNAFGAKEVFYYSPDSKKWDRRGAVGTYHYVDIHYLNSLVELKKLKQKYHFIGVDCIDGVSIPIETFTWPENSLMLFGEEKSGLAPEIIMLCDSIVHITQFGSVPSLNVGTASGIAMFDYLQKKQTHHQ